MLDSLIEQATERTAMATLIRPIGMFYGDVLTHTIPGAHWKVIKEDFPEVGILRKTSVSVIHVAQRLLTVGVPTLVMNYDHALERLNREPLQDQ